LRYKHSDKVFWCEYNVLCSKYFKSDEERLEHYREGHEKGISKVACLYCGKMFEAKTIHVHLRTSHKNEAPLKCDHYNCTLGLFFKNEEDKQKREGSS
jgi:hypothetical protein